MKYRPLILLAVGVIAATQSSRLRTKSARVGPRKVDQKSTSPAQRNSSVLQGESAGINVIKSSSQAYADLFRGDLPTGELRVLEAYKVAMDVRKFEIELYWKRAAYFWAFIVVALGGYGACLGSTTLKNPEKSESLFTIACIGMVLAVAMHLVNLGSKFWQRNWEYQSDLLEDAAIGPLYKHVFSKAEEKKSLLSARPYSVSRINSILSLFFTCIFLLFVVKDSSVINCLQAPACLFQHISWMKVVIASVGGGFIFFLLAGGVSTSTKAGTVAKGTGDEDKVKVDELKVEHTYRKVTIKSQESLGGSKEKAPL